MISFTPEEIEETRLESLAELDQEEAAKFVPGSFGYHEALDRASVVLNILDNTLMEHPAIVSDPDAFRQVHEVHTMIFNLYQYLGEKHLVDEEPK